MPPAPSLLKIRQAIRDKGAAWKKATSGAAFKKRFRGVCGDAATRPPKGFDGDHPRIEDIKRKSFFTMAEARPASAKKLVFVDDVAATFTDAKPLMKFRCDAVGARF